ncbi:MAG: hypothetical protein EXS00_08335 [Phycisphaerales bacterium]|nr:hypothetical protein [Phycisphaerales bacterium]
MYEDFSNQPPPPPPQAADSDPEFDALVARYKLKLSVIYTEIEAAIQSGDLATIQIISHRLHGVAGGMGSSQWWLLPPLSSTQSTMECRWG